MGIVRYKLEMNSFQVCEGLYLRETEGLVRLGEANQEIHHLESLYDLAVVK